jgi:hypothetical protein
MLCMYCGEPIHQNTDPKYDTELIGHWIHSNALGSTAWSCQGTHNGHFADCATHRNSTSGPTPFLDKVVPITSSSLFTPNPLPVSREVKYVEFTIGRRFRDA